MGLSKYRLTEPHDLKETRDGQSVPYRIPVGTVMVSFGYLHPYGELVLAPNGGKYCIPRRKLQPVWEQVATTT
jgi:hypothetical protein